MKKIGLLSDTHGFLFPRMLNLLKECDEIWHAGDVGDAGVVEKLSGIKPVRAVFGNIDGEDIRRSWPEVEVFTIPDLSLLVRCI